VASSQTTSHKQDGWQVEQLTLTSHAGSHLDAPLHKLAGAPSIDAFPLERFTGPAFIVDCRTARPRQPFTSSLLNRTLRQQTDLKDKIILLATGWGDKRAATELWESQSPFLAPDGAEWLVDQEIRGVGIDHFSIGGTVEPSNSLTHQILLSANIWVAEDLRFPAEVFDLPQPLQFWALPINLRQHGGAWCRPVIAV
jgi:kynurenine formamidase